MSEFDTYLNQPVGDVVVTGGAGAIGSMLVRRLLTMGAESVTVVDDLSSGYLWLLPEDPRVKFIEADVANLFELDIAAKEPLIFHMAAFFANQNSVDHPLDDLHTNGKGTLTTFMWAAQKSARRVVYASAGCSIAGHGIEAPIREDMPVSLFLDTPYQITKALGEFYANYYLERVSSVRCRFFNSYGPSEVPGRYRNVIPNFIWWAMNGKPLPITGTGEETRDFIYVEDMVDGLIRCGVVPQAHGRALNLGTGIQTKIIDLANMVNELTGSGAGVEFRPRRSWDHSKTRQADISEAKKTIGLNPTVPVSEGVRRTVKWFCDNREHIAEVMRSEP